MRKAIVLLLAVVLTMSLALPAMALTPSVQAKLPEAVEVTTKTEDGKEAKVSFSFKQSELTAEQKAEIDTRKDEIVATAGVKKENITTVTVSGIGDSKVTISVAALAEQMGTNLDNCRFFVVIDGKLVELKPEMKDGVLVIPGLGDGELYIVPEK